MMKKLLSFLMVLVLALSVASVSVAEDTELLEFHAVVASELDVLADAATALQSDNRNMATAVIFFEYTWFAVQEDMELSLDALNNDALICHRSNGVMCAFDFGDSHLIVNLNTVTGEMQAASLPYPFAYAQEALASIGYEDFYTVDGSGWTTMFNAILDVLAED